MGGNALDFETVRLEKAEYEDIKYDVLLKLEAAISSFGLPIVSVITTTRGQLPVYSAMRRLADIPAYRTKESFGDLDILVETFPGDKINYKELIQNKFNPAQIVHNGNCYSFDYKNFQVDLILTPTQDFATSYYYFSWNDLGNLAGRIYKKLGFKYGHEGLVYMFREDDLTYSVFDEANVSKDTKEILEFGDLNYDEFMAGFDTLEQMFVWVSNSKYFHKDIYLLHNRNHTSRVRDKKRKNYNLFLKWCETAEGLNAYPWTEMREQDGYAGKPEFLQMALAKFDDFEKVYDEKMKKHEQEKLFKSNFNGNNVSELTGLEGKELGAFMQHIIKSQGGKEVMQDNMWFLEAADVVQIILDQWLNYEPD